VALLSIDPWIGPPEGFRPFNYSIRKIQAALSTEDGLTVEVLDFYSPDVDALEAEVERRDPDFVGASAYVWSLPAFVELATRLKRNRPDRVICFGGPSARPAMLAQKPFAHAIHAVDALVLGEGELVIRELAAHVRDRRPRAALRDIAGLALPVDGAWLTTGPRSRVADLDALPSPYQLGLVPPRVTAHLETFRGCPFTCTFCEWGVLGSASPVFSREYLVRELHALRKAGAIGAFSIDAALNLNARAFRNLKAAVEETGVFREIDFHCELYPSHVTDEHIELLRGMKQAEVGIGLQSFDPEVLRGVERPFDPDRFDAVLAAIAKVASPTLLIIMGLPGDNPRSFRRTLERCLRYGCMVHVYHCLVLPDALMTRAPAEFALEFDPVSLKMRSCLGWSEDDFKREWDHVQEIVAARGGECVPFYYCQIRGDRRAYDVRRAAERFGNFAASSETASQPRKLPVVDPRRGRS
jgi:radical SAM superfamily enzyme YgiQ (UPF0313 family)